MYYMSMEFLMGRSLLNALFNLDVAGAYGEALAEMGYNLETLVEQERDAVSGLPHACSFSPWTDCAMLCAMAAAVSVCWRGQDYKIIDVHIRSSRRWLFTGAGQRRPGAPGCLLHGLHGHAQPAGLGLRHPVPVRHVPTGALATCGSLHATSCWPCSMAAHPPCISIQCCRASWTASSTSSQTTGSILATPGRSSG